MKPDGPWTLEFAGPPTAGELARVARALAPAGDAQLAEVAVSTVPASSIAAAGQGTGSQSVPDMLRAALKDGPASGTALAARIGRRKVVALAGLRDLLAAGEVRLDGRGPAARYVLADRPRPPRPLELARAVEPAPTPPAPVPVMKPARPAPTPAPIRVVAPCSICAETGSCFYCGGDPDRRCVYCWGALAQAQAAQAASA